MELYWTNYQYGMDLRVELAYTNLRKSISTLKLFTSLKRLRIFLRIKSSTEKATYLDFLKAIVTSKFRGTLEHLEFRIDTKTDCSQYTEGAGDDRYREIYSGLSTQNQGFFSAQIPSSDELNRFMAANSQCLPALKSARFTVDNAPLPMDNFESKTFQQYGFHYKSLMLAPKLRDLHISITKIPDDTCITNDAIKIESCPEILHAFSQITTLRLEIPSLPDSIGIQRLVERFPNLKDLEIQLNSNRLWSYEKDENLHLYDEIGNLNKLEMLALPWPRLTRGSVSPNALRELCCWWRMEGLDRLGAVTFTGIKCAAGSFQDIQLHLYFVGTGTQEGDWNLGMFGDSHDADWMDV
ncbi:hypothetical protein TWF730_008678 [Orbilia blumenaviensis]|uniref:Uncharacterized protein n=1 Tax=Orbilia blumenaviensis TaxID=1796055 RepID=A0AAV9V5E1_9PEZI